MRPLQTQKLLTLIAPNELRPLIIDTLRECGIGGYTLWPASGAGASGIRSGFFDADSNVLIEIILSEPNLQSVLERMESLMDGGYRLKVLVTDIQVLTRK